MDYGTNRLHLCDHWDNYGLSFVWPLDGMKMIVHGGGYNEPVVANIPMENFLDAADGNLTDSVCAAFHAAADEFIEWVDSVRGINVDTVVTLFLENNLDALPEALDNTDKFEFFVPASVIVSIAEAHYGSLGETKNYG